MQVPSLIPRPESVTSLGGVFRLRAGAVIAADDAAQSVATYLRRRLAPVVGEAIEIAQAGTASRRAASPQIELRLTAETELGAEGYRLEVTDAGVRLHAATAAGLFHGVQTLLQLLPQAVEAPAAATAFDACLPAVRIVDRPRFAWRGFMLDEGRHFHGKATVLDLLDVMAMLKLNVFHWHLTEDQGWRIAIDAFPKLTEVASRRAGTARGLVDMLLGRHDGVPHAGIYTADDIREVVAYAAERHIEVVPEIEMPGHSKAAVAAYPELSCSGGPFTVPTRFGIFRDIYCAGKESTFTFLETVLERVLELFPGRYVHIGGDEAPMARWQKCPDCRRRMQTEGLASPRELQTYFTNRMAGFLARRGRRAIGWNEILGPGLHPGAVVQYWVRHREHVVEAARHGCKIIVSPFFDYYLDHSYWLTPLSRTYRHEPVFRELDAAAADNILGIEAPLWTEFVPSRARLDYQAFPRLLAVAETAWTPRVGKDELDFVRRYRSFRGRLERRGIECPADAEIEPNALARRLGLLTVVFPRRRVARRAGNDSHVAQPSK